MSIMNDSEVELSWINLLTQRSSLYAYQTNIQSLGKINYPREGSRATKPDSIMLPKYLRQINQIRMKNTIRYATAL